MTTVAPAKKKSWYRTPLVAAVQYPLMRFWTFMMNCFSLETNLATGRMIGRIWWTISPRHRKLAIQHLRDSFPTEYSDDEITDIARRSFEHFAQVYLIELAMTPRALTRSSWPRHIELTDLSDTIRELLQGRSAIMVTPHFGNIELLGFALCRMGVPLVAVMRPLDDPRMNAFLVETRAASGLRLLDKKGMTYEAASVIERGVPLCFIADQDAGKKAYFVDFFGRKASTYKSIGLLAVQHDLPVIVGYAARIGRGLRYRIEVNRIIRPEDWVDKDNAALWITEEFSAAMEAGIRKYPEQYLWVHRRWKSRPKGE
ncbi:MAG: lysophospholipid acyltransferase family protein [Phycisphaerae bacterium]